MRITKPSLRNKIKQELDSGNPSLENILKIVEEHRKSNQIYLDKLKRERHYESKRINGAIKQFMSAHPILTKELIGSLTKRIQGALLANDNKTDSGFIRINKGTLVLVAVGLMVMIGILICIV